MMTVVIDRHSYAMNCYKQAMRVVEVLGRGKIVEKRANHRIWLTFGDAHEPEIDR
jgi:hypothetical protein